jgi:hypothetical protein
MDHFISSDFGGLTREHCMGALLDDWKFDRGKGHTDVRDSNKRCDRFILIDT